MNELNRPSEKDAASKATSFQGGNVPQEIFKHGFLPFCGVSTLTVAVLTFDLISDWLAWRSVSELHLQTDLLDRHETRFQALRSIYAQIPLLYLSFCVIASSLTLIELCRVLRLLVLQKRKLKESLDGVPYKRTSFDKYSGEILLPLLVLLEDLPFSLIVFALQLVAQCPLVVPLPNPMILTSVCATCISLVWKVGQVIWRSGCCCQRSDFSCSWPLGILRAFSVVATLSALSVTMLNLLLLTRPSFLPSTNSAGHVMSSASYARWLREDRLFLVARETDVSDPSWSFMDPIDISALESAVTSDQRLFVRPCDNTTLPFIAPLNASSVAQCQVLLMATFSIERQSLFYDLSYRTSSSDGCHQGRFLPLVAISNNESQSTNISLSLSLSRRYQPDWSKCDLHMMQNTSMFTFDPCASAPVVTVS